MLANGETPLISCGPSIEPVGVKQRRFLHGPTLGQISDQARVNGQRYTTDTWKEHFRRLFLGDGGFRWEVMRLPGAKRSTPRRIAISTEELGVRAYAEFTNKVIDYAALELGVAFIFTNEEQSLLRHKPKGKASGND